MPHRKAAIGTTAVALAAALGLTTGAVPSGAVEDETVEAATAWLATQQEADGGFGPDTGAAILSLAAAGQLAEDWSAADGLAAVEAVVNDEGRTPIDALDDAAEAPATTAIEAARLIPAAVVLGLDPEDVDPRDDSAAPVDLVAAVQGAAGPGDDWSGLAVEEQAVVALGLAAATYTAPPPEEEPPPDAPAAEAEALAVPSGLVDALRAAQQADGLWSASGAAADAPSDATVTGLVLQALAASGIGSTDFSIIRALQGLARSMSPLGGWPWGADLDVTGTAAIAAGLTALTLDPSDPCWRDVQHTGWAGVRYNDPVEAIRLLQATDGSFDGAAAPTTAAVQLILASSPLLTIGQPAEPVELECPEPTVEEALVHSIYYPVLGRLADPGGTAYYAASLLAETSTPGSIATSLLGSREYERHAVHTAFEVLGRRADPGALAYFSTYVPKRQHLLRARVLGSNEFFRRSGGTNAAFAEALYQQVLGRLPSAGEAAAVDDALATGGLRTPVALSVVRSSEAMTREVSDLFISVLGTPADLAGLLAYRQQLQSGGVEQVITAMVDSEAFVAAPD